MKRKEKTELREMKSEALLKKAGDLRRDITTAIRERATKPQKNVKAVWGMKNRLAVMLTIAKEKRKT